MAPVMLAASSLTGTASTAVDRSALRGRGTAAAAPRRAANVRAAAAAKDDATSTAADRVALVWTARYCVCSPRHSPWFTLGEQGEPGERADVCTGGCAGERLEVLQWASGVGAPLPVEREVYEQC
jgi:nucleoid-associated protein YgaU